MPMRGSVESGRARVVVLAAAVWLVAVTGTTTLAWVVIDRAGRSIGSTPTAQAGDLGARAARSPSSAPSAPGPATGSGTSPGQPSARPSVTASRSSAPSAAGSTATDSVRAPTTTTSSTGSSSPQQGTSPSRAPTTRPAAPPPTRTPPPVAPPGVQRVAQVPGGEVAVRCAGAAITLRWAQPDDGYSVETGSGGSAELEVTFRSSAGGVERETQVHATCQRGAPVLAVETQSSSGD